RHGSYLDPLSFPTRRSSDLWSGDEAESFFLRLYKPTPILAPWNGGSGFYNKDNKAALIAILNSSTPRLELYRECIRLSEEALSRDRKSTRLNSSHVKISYAV